MKISDKLKMLMILAAVCGMFAAGLGLGRISQAQAQTVEVVFIEGTVPVSDALTEVLADAIVSSGEGVRTGAEYYAVTDLMENDGWLTVSVVGLAGISDMSSWNIIDHGVWFSSVLVQTDGAGFANAAVFGTEAFAELAARTPDTVIGLEAKQAIAQTDVQQAVGEDFIMPFPSGYLVKYGYLAVHDGWGWPAHEYAVDLFSDGDTSSGNAPNYLIAASSGLVSYRCNPSQSSYTSTAIKVGEFLYAHLIDSTLNVQVNGYVDQGTYLGKLQPGTFEESPCGYAYQQSNSFHVHFSFNGDSLTLSGWTLNVNTEIWSDGSDTWVSNTWKKIGELEQGDLIIDSISFDPAVPAAGEPVTATLQVTNQGGPVFTPFTVDLYVTSGEPLVCGELGDYSTVISTLGTGETVEVQFEVAGQPAGSYDIYGHVDTNCVIDEGYFGDPPTPEDNNLYGPDVLQVIASTTFFVDDFETGDFSTWTRYNDGRGWLYPCEDAAVNGSWGACVERGDNDKRKQLIDETPVDKTDFNVRLSFDVNSLSMGEGERFRFLQVKMDGMRPFLIVLKYQGGQYYIQLKTLMDDTNMVKTDWYLLTDQVHTIEVGWQAASAEGADDGQARLYMDGSLLEALTGLDNDTIFIENLKIGFTSRLDGKTISGMFYVDDVATGVDGYLGLP